MTEIVCMVKTRPVGRKRLNRDRLQITLPQGMAAALDEAAKERGWDRSRLIEELAAAFLKKRAKGGQTTARAGE